MKRIILLTLLIIALTGLRGAAATIEFSGVTHAPVTLDPARSTGLAQVYVLHSTGGVTLVYNAATPQATVSAERFSHAGAANPDATCELTHQSGTSQWTMPLENADCGYTFTEGTTVTYIWIIDYSQSPCTIAGIAMAPAEEQDCGTAALAIEGSAPSMSYYSINGRPVTVDREIIIGYNTQVANQETLNFEHKHIEQTLPSAQGIVRVQAPLSDTRFTLRADRFLRAWDQELTVESQSYAARAVDAVTDAVQTNTPASNQQTGNIDALGGSAPTDITFSAAVSDAAIFHEWQLSTYPEFDDIDMRATELQWTYTFREMGTFYVRLVAANDDASCDYYSETYTITVGESRLLCPNAFSPGISEGVNDEWKVSYQSIVEFECYIFNRWGVKMTEFSDPSQGWDGRYKGKLVPAGVYYYVIKARGADGKEYKLSGDINILHGS